MASPSFFHSLFFFFFVVVLVAFVFLLPVATTSNENDQQQPVAPSTLRLPPEEQEAAYLVLESVNPSFPWRSLYPDDLCLSGPHGLLCDLFDDEPHVVELNFGYVSDFSANPDCGPNATLPSAHTLSSFPHLRKLFFYDCFSSDDARATDAFAAGFWNALPSSLEELVFVRNPSLAGRLSACMAGLHRLRRLVISGTRISGIVPSEIGEMRRLEQLVLSGNRLHGPIPQTVGELDQLKILDLSGNRLAGNLPMEIGRLAELAKLDLSSNRIAGPVPAELGSLRQLELLDLSRNRLTGGIPAALAEMASLKELYLSGNRRLGGMIPPEIWEKLGGILGIGMSDLGLMGNIPPSMGVFLENICYLALDNNKLEGEVPDQFKRLERSAREIHLENNVLRGRVPFSAGFVGRMGGKLKLGGNPKLCLGDELLVAAAGSGGAGGSLGFLRPCNNSEIPHPILFTSGAFGVTALPKIQILSGFLVLFLGFKLS